VLRLWHHLVPQISLERRGEVQVRMRESSHALIKMQPVSMKTRFTNSYGILISHIHSIILPGDIINLAGIK
jgi:hypothetical protein